MQKIRKKSAARKVLLGIPLLLIVLVGIVYGYYHAKLGLLQYNDGVLSRNMASTSTEDSTVAEAEMAKYVSRLGETELIPAQDEVVKNNNVFNILLIGPDERSASFSDNARGDTCMLLSINRQSKAIRLVSFERSMGMPIFDGIYKGQYDWLTHTFRYGGASLMMLEIQKCFRLDVSHYIRVNIHTFMEGIEAIGGINIDLTQAEADYINYPEGSFAACHIAEMGVDGQIQAVTAGANYLNGATSMLYVRCRWVDSDWFRMEQQRNVITAAVRQISNLSLTQLNEMLNTELPLIQTNLTEAEITSFLPLVLDYQKLFLEQIPIPAEGAYGGMTGMYAVDFQKNSKTLQELISK